MCLAQPRSDLDAVAAWTLCAAFTSLGFDYLLGVLQDTSQFWLIVRMQDMSLCVFVWISDYFSTHVCAHDVSMHAHDQMPVYGHHACSLTCLQAVLFLLKRLPKMLDP